MKKDKTVWIFQNYAQDATGIYTNLSELIRSNSLQRQEPAIRRALSKGFAGIQLSGRCFIDNVKVNEPLDRINRTNYYYLIPR
ncbi:hypothetical protein [Dyadobacter sp. 32]|uniref:hypothetical protein n=1 Tax=Dyadobacter sp. 32 TaxID=538966 RepID=UPI0011EE18E7